ncbi:MAG: hypothetical protein AB7O49_18795 [Sphingomonadales bacterium]
MTRNPLLGIWLDGWSMSLDVPAVVALRALRIARGGERGRAEARRMIREKLETAAALHRRALSGRLGATPADAAAKAVAHCAAKVRANRRRLGHGRG